MARYGRILQKVETGRQTAVPKLISRMVGHDGERQSVDHAGLPGSSPARVTTCEGVTKTRRSTTSSHTKLSALAAKTRGVE